MIKIEKFFNAADCEASKELESQAVESKVGYDKRRSVINGDIRESKSWPVASQVTKRLETQLRKFSKEITKCIVQEIHGVTYEAGGYFEWHKDNYGDNKRALTGIILLSEPSEFEGGIFYYKNSNGVKRQSLKRGDLLMFDSKLEHKVAAVTFGTRKVIVFWIHD